MEYALFFEMKQVGSLYFTFEEAKAMINGKGIWNICGILPIDGQLRIVNKVTIEIN